MTQGAPPAPAEPAHAHLYVFAQGGAPQVVIDGTARNEAACEFDDPGLVGDAEERAGDGDTVGHGETPFRKL